MIRGLRPVDPVEESVLERLGLANLIGASLSFLTSQLTDSSSSTRNWAFLYAFLVYLFVMLPAGGALAHVTMRVLRERGQKPLAPETRRRILRLPFVLACESMLFWIGAAIFFSAFNYLVDNQTVLFSVRVAGVILLAGLTTAGVAYLLSERALLPVYREILADGPVESEAGLGIRTRLLVSWALGSAIPLLIIALAFVGQKQSRNPNLRAAVWTLVAVGIIAGAIVIINAARSVSEPLDEIRAALGRVQRDDLDVVIPVDDAGEVGMLQSGFNQMVGGLRDRRELEDLFGRHVGTDVAQLARAQGVRLGGERREASVVFVDLVGSSRLAQSRPADEVVALLNSFFTTVVDRIEQEGGWVNKFEGDGAVCVFGAPASQPDHATRALRAARTLRRDLLALALTHPELSAGIGVSAGDVAAGNVGAAHRYEYTVIGDPVNEAARLTEYAKTRPGGVVASEDAIVRAGESERHRWVVADELALRGREQPTLAYEPREDVPESVESQLRGRSHQP